MAILILGLAIFIAAHSLPIAPGLRESLRMRMGANAYRGLVSVASLLGLVLIVWGYATARSQGSPALWDPPVWTRHLAVALNLVAMVLIVAAYAPPGRIKAALRHPMIAGVKVWALAHLLANGTLADLVLFGGILAWAVVDRISLKRREAAGLIARPAGGPARNDLAAVVGGIALWALIAFWLHRLVIGVSPLG